MKQLELSFWKKENGYKSATGIGMILILVAGYTYFNYDNQYFSSSVFLGLLFSPYIFRWTSQAISYRFLWIALVLGALLCFRHSSSLFYFFLVASLLFVLESTWGKLNNLPVFLLALISALIGHVVYVWSFPIRLQLSSWAAKCLSIIGMDTTASGNTIIRNGYEFSVDPACMGLNMLVTAGILGLLMLAHFERRQRYTFSMLQTGAYLSVILLLAVVANFIRLLTLIVFRIGPGHPMHSGVGLFSLLVYALIPFYLWLAYGNQWPERNTPGADEGCIVNRAVVHRTIFPYALLLFLFLYNGPKFLSTPVVFDHTLSELQLPGFESSLLENGVLKLENEVTLVYIKPPAGPLQGTHDPRICWEGTGYTFTHIQRRQIGEEEVYTARLEKDNETLYTAWWFDNGREQTVREWRWRWYTLRSGRGFRLVNVTTAGAIELEREVMKLKDIWSDK
ncbi:MAG: exosortase N [Saprospiraceae bacterium]|nr:exosortase N [Lewinella sp.]